jgi:hypothetical protein
MIDDKVENFSDASESVFSQFVFQGFVVYKGLDINEKLRRRMKTFTSLFALVFLTSCAPLIASESLS